LSDAAYPLAGRSRSGHRLGKLSAIARFDFPVFRPAKAGFGMQNPL